MGLLYTTPKEVRTKAERGEKLSRREEGILRRDDKLQERRSVAAEKRERARNTPWRPPRPTAKVRRLAHRPLRRFRRPRAAESTGARLVLSACCSEQRFQPC